MTTRGPPPDREVVMLGPRAHRDGTLALLGDMPPPFRELVNIDLPEIVPPATNGLKYDVYRVSDGGSGFTVNDRWEGPEFFERLDRLLTTIGGRWARPLRISAAVTTVSVAFDRGNAPGAPPRIKVYQQEDHWGVGVIDVATLRGLGWEVPEGVVGRAGVVTTELFEDGREGRKVYIGGPSAEVVTVGTPASTLVSRLAACTLPGWYYLTVRLRPGGAPRYALNKVYNVVDIAFSGRDLLAAVCAEVTTLTGMVLPRVAGVLTVPTAVAIDETTADAYCAGWAVPTFDPETLS